MQLTVVWLVVGHASSFCRVAAPNQDGMCSRPLETIMRPLHCHLLERTQKGT